MVKLYLDGPPFATRLQVSSTNSVIYYYSVRAEDFMVDLVEGSIEGCLSLSLVARKVAIATL